MMGHVRAAEHANIREVMYHYMAALVTLHASPVMVISDTRVAMV